MSIYHMYMFFDIDVNMCYVWPHGHAVGVGVARVVVLAQHEQEEVPHSLGREAVCVQAVGQHHHKLLLH